MKKTTTKKKKVEKIDTDDAKRLMEMFICENGDWNHFVRFIEQQGYTEEEIGVEN